MRSDPLRNGYLADLALHKTKIAEVRDSLQLLYDAAEDDEDMMHSTMDQMQELLGNYGTSSQAVKKVVAASLG